MKFDATIGHFQRTVLASLCFAVGACCPDDDANAGLITTSAKDTYRQVVTPPDFDPTVVTLDEVLLGPQGGILVVATGLHQFTLQTICVDPGRTSPNGIAPSLAARPVGQNSDLLLEILSGVARHPEVPLRDAQLLVWAIAAGEPLSSVDDSIYETAQVLMSSESIQRLEDDALESALEAVLLTAGGAELQDLFSYIDAVRALTRDGAPYDEVESAAVPSISDAAPGTSAWFEDDSGVFVRFRPQAYTLVEVELFAPSVLSAEARLGAAFEALGTDSSEQLLADPIEFLPSQHIVLGADDTTQRLALTSRGKRMNSGSAASRLQDIARRMCEAGLPTRLLYGVARNYNVTSVLSRNSTFPALNLLNYAESVLDGAYDFNVGEGVALHHGTIFHEAVHGWLDMQSDSSPYKAFIELGEDYYNDAPSIAGPLDGDRVFQEAVADYASTRMVAYLNAVSLLHGANGAEARAVIRDSYNLQVSERVFGYAEVNGNQVETTRPMSDDIKTFIDRELLESRIPDHFDDVPEFTTKPQAQTCTDP